MRDPGAAIAAYPLFERFPALERIPRARLTTLPTPVERLAPTGAPNGAPSGLWIKRDDLSATVMGGNKVRALEFLLGPVREGDTVLTVGGEGSVHVLATAVHAARLGARTIAIRWRHEMNPQASAVAREAARICARVTTTRTPAGTLARAMWMRLRDRTLHWITIGGSTPLGMLGHVNAALELERQIDAGALPRPSRVVVPLGSGGTAAGLSLGFAIAGAPTVVVGARVGPRLVVSRSRVRRLARAAARLIETATGERVPRLARGSVEVVHDVYGGAYGRPLPAGERAAASLMDWRGVPLDATYSAKAFAAALSIAHRAEDATLFWLTYDGRPMAARS